MSNEALQQFYDHVRATPSLEIQATEALKEGPEALVLLARLEGFEFTEQELVAALAEQGAIGEDELSDTDLDLVAGGVSVYRQKDFTSKRFNG